MRAILERLGKLIPGYRGYANLEDLRDSDYKLRLFAKRILEDFISSIEKFKLSLSDNEIIELDKVQNELKLFCIKLTNQKYGYKSLFQEYADTGGINKSALELVIENDDKFLAILKDIESKNLNTDSLNNLVLKLENILKDRREILA